MRFGFKPVAAFALLAVALGCAACQKQITIESHSDTTDLKVDGEKIGDLMQDETKKVDVPAVGSFEITWTNYDDEHQSETLWGENISDGDTWHLYHGYGSFDEW